MTGVLNVDLVIALCAVGAAGLVTLVATTGRPLQPLLADDGQSFLDVAEHVVKYRALPPIEVRPPVYPLVLAAFMALSPSPLRHVVFFQAACWIGSALLVAMLVSQLSGRAVVAALGGIAYTTLSHSQFLIRLIYAEAMTITLALAAAVALIAGLGQSGGGWLWLAASLATLAAYARPVFQVLLPLFGLLALVDGLLGSQPWLPRVLPFVAAVVVALAPWYVMHKVVRGAPFFTKGTGYTLVNYLGDRRLLGHFPPAYAELERAYATRFAARPQQRYIGWWELYAEWPRLYEARTGSPLPLDLVDSDMRRTATAILRHNPGYLATRWFETWREFSTHPGWSPKGDFSPIRLAFPCWRVFFSYLGLWLPFAILGGEILLLIFGRAPDVARLVPIAVFVAIALVNTAMEPWPGQVRYRAALDAFLVAAVVSFAARLAWTLAQR